MLYALPRSNTAGLLGGYYLLAFLYRSEPPNRYRVDRRQHRWNHEKVHRNESV